METTRGEEAGNADLPFNDATGLVHEPRTVFCQRPAEHCPALGCRAGGARPLIVCPVFGQTNACGSQLT